MLSDRELSRLLTQLEREERSMSRRRNKLHKRIDFVRAGGYRLRGARRRSLEGLSRTEHEVSSRRHALHDRIDAMRVERSRRRLDRREASAATRPCRSRSAQRSATSTGARRPFGSSHWGMWLTMPRIDIRAMSRSGIVNEPSRAPDAQDLVEDVLEALARLAAPAPGRIGLDQAALLVEHDHVVAVARHVRDPGAEELA